MRALGAAAFLGLEFILAIGALHLLLKFGRRLPSAPRILN